MEHNEPKKRVGRELVERLGRFTKKLETLDRVADISQVLTVRKVKLNLQPRAFDADEVKSLRARLNISQPVFAEFLGIATSTLRDWEQGITEPSGLACRLLEEISRDVAAWATRIRELSMVTAN